MTSGPTALRRRGEPSKSSSKLEVAYATVRSRIIDGTYGPGFRLVLDQISRELSMSPLPVREAVRRLEAEGYIEFARNVGPRVASIDPDKYAHVMNVLAVLEGYATASAAPTISESALARAAALNSDMATARLDFDPVAFTTLNKQFHFVFYESCPNPHVRQLIESEWARLEVIRRSSFIYVPGRAAGSVHEHDQLVELVRRRAPVEEIEHAARAHKIATATALVSGIRSEPVPSAVGGLIEK
ncbi:MAG: GntR family transcriptional regulator [Acidimicrobiales bacterium]